jgi:hypothetical protein
MFFMSIGVVLFFPHAHISHGLSVRKTGKKRHDAHGDGTTNDV